MDLIRAAQGAIEWATCNKAKPDVALAQLNVCRTCPSALIGKAFGRLWLTCGPVADGDGLQRTPPTCGCVLGSASKEQTERIETEKDTTLRRALALDAMRPEGKTTCLIPCTQGKWSGYTQTAPEQSDANRGQDGYVLPQ